MASNLELSEPEQRVLDHVKQHKRSRTIDQIRGAFEAEYGFFDSIIQTDQAIANLVSQSFISMDADGQYHAVGGAL